MGKTNRRAFLCTIRRKLSCSC